MKVFLATYGTLRLEGMLKQTPELRCALMRGQCKIPGQLFQVGGFPVLKPGMGFVIGDLLELPAHFDFRCLDRYEDYHPTRPQDCRYVRRRIRLVSPRLEAWAYYYAWPVDASTRFRHGDWLQAVEAGLKVRRFREDRRALRHYPPDGWVATAK